MQENYLIISIIAVIAIVLISLFIVVANLQKTVVIESPTPTPEQKEKEQKIEELKKSQANKIDKFKPKKIRDIKKHYQKKKQELLENEKQFGYIGRILIEGIDIHDPDFEKLIMEKIK